MFDHVIFFYVKIKLNWIKLVSNPECVASTIVTYLWISAVYQRVLNLTGDRQQSPAAVLQLFCGPVQNQDPTLVPTLILHPKVVQTQGGDVTQGGSPWGHRVREAERRRKWGIRHPGGRTTGRCSTWGSPWTPGLRPVSSPRTSDLESLTKNH